MWLSLEAFELCNSFQVVREMASVILLHAICLDLLDMGCDHIGGLKVQSFERYDQVSSVENEASPDFYLKF